MSGWIECRIRDVGKVITGKTPSKNNPEFWGDKVPFITPTDFKSDSKYLTKTDRYLSEEGIRNFNRLRIPQDSIIVTCIGSDMGKVVFNRFEAVTNQQINSLLVSDEYDRDFIYYKLKSIYRKLRLFADSGSTMPIINKSAFESIKIRLPSVKKKQRELSSILSSLDNKIDLLRRQNETLEKIAQALFKRWFVEFEFPDKNGKPYKSSGGKMIPSELGDIPEGWRVGKLSQIADIAIGRTPPRKEKEWFSTDPNDIKWISIKDLGNAGVYINDSSEYLTREAVEQFNVPIIPRNTVVVSFKLTVGRVAISTGEMLSNEAIAHLKIIDQNDISVPYLYLFIRQYDFTILGSTSSIATAVNSKSIKSIDILLPSGKVIKLFTTITESIFHSIANNTIQIQTLTCLRDTLLPKLMSGQIRIKVSD